LDERDAMLERIADIHERPSRVPALLNERGATVEITHLLAGDYQLRGSALVERKTVRGMHIAIVAGTFWSQVGRLRALAATIHSPYQR
jgi:ERCC4-type nuclease